MPGKSSGPGCLWIYSWGYGPWTTLGELRPGALFETPVGWRGVKEAERAGSAGRCARSLENGSQGYLGDWVEVREILMHWPRENKEVEGG